MKIKFLTWLLMLFSIAGYGQTISGNVSDASGTPLPGVSIAIVGENTGTTTDLDGNYSITAEPDDVLQFSYLGMQTQTVTVGAGTVIDIVLQEDIAQLNEVVVTAFGIQKAKRSVGYAVQEVGSDELNRNGNQDVLSALQGKVAGVNINTTSGAAGAGSSIVIRGITSLNATADNQPLFIVDGIPISNAATPGSVLPSTGSNAPSSSEQFSFTNRGADINPNDVESVSILKGPAATALYGLRAANGVVVITTKKGRTGEMKFNLRSTVGWSEVNKTPEVQTRWREGRAGEAVSTEDPTSETGYSYAPGYSFGFWALGPEYGPGEPIYDNFRDLFRKAGTASHIFSLSGGKENFTYFGSLSRSDEQGIVPNTYFDRTSVKFSGNIKLSNKFSIEPSISAIISDARMPNGGDKSIMSSLSYWAPSIDVNDYLTANGGEKNYSNGIVDNPRYFAEVSSLDSKVNRFIGNTKLSYAFTDELSLQYQIGIDNYHDSRLRFVPPDIDPGSAVQGFIVNQAINYSEINSNLFLTYNKVFNEDLTGSFLVGNQITDIRTRSVLNRAEGLDPANLMSFAAATNFFDDFGGIEQNIVGLFGDLRLEYKNALYLNITGRNDWSSTLPKDSRSFFYPAVSLSYVISQSLEDAGSLPGFLTYAKLRASYAEVGKDARPYATGIYYDRPSNFPFGNVDGFSQDSGGGSDQLRPERTVGVEFGGDFRFFRNRLGFDLTYYKQNSKDQIFSVPVAQSSGFSSYVLNAGEVENVGLELLLNVTPVRTTNFNWDINFNWSKVESEVLSLPEGIDEIIFADSGFPGVVSRLVVGGSPGDLYGYTYTYNANGDRIIGADGYADINTSERVLVGNAFPDWLGSVGSTISWKGLSFSFLLEHKEGGDVYDSAQRNGIRNGVLKITEVRDVEMVLDGVLEDGTPNNIPVLIDENYYRNSSHYNRASEILVEDASWWRLRNLTLSYQLPAGLIDNTFFERVTFSFTGTNLWLDTDYRGYDPEGSQFSAGSNAYGFTGLQIPSTKSFLFGVNVNF